MEGEKTPIPSHVPTLGFLLHYKQNFGISVAFGIAFLAAYLIITEFRSKLAEKRSVFTFRRGTTEIRTSVPKAQDVETGASTDANFADNLRGDYAKVEKALATAEKMSNTFSWRGLSYTVPTCNGGERRLLNDVSGYVVPGKLTALMGESGAGKVRTPSPTGISD